MVVGVISPAVRMGGFERDEWSTEATFFIFWSLGGSDGGESESVDEGEDGVAGACATSDAAVRERVPTGSVASKLRVDSSVIGNGETDTKDDYSRQYGWIGIQAFAWRKGYDNDNF
jgi:hypothetical protein